tara:strand:+ start:275 stop:727 length:453 start_codon:yes stop_codon:yes gene_type:complete
MATKTMKTRRSCKYGKLKKPVRTKKGGKRRCKKSKSDRKTRSRRRYNIRSKPSEDRYRRRIYRNRRAVMVGNSRPIDLGKTIEQRKREQKARRALSKYRKQRKLNRTSSSYCSGPYGFGCAPQLDKIERQLIKEANYCSDTYGFGCPPRR